MKIIFEYEDGTYRIIPRMDITKIHEPLPEHKQVANFLTDTSDFFEGEAQFTCFGYGNHIVRCKRMYLIANDNKLGGFGLHRDIQTAQKNIKYLQRRLGIHQRWMYELNKLEDLSVFVEKSPEEQAIDEIFEFAEQRSWGNPTQ